MFSDKYGHEAVIEILLCKPKDHASKPYIKILNGLVHIPQLVQKLIESGLIETVKLVNDLYNEDLDVIATNFDTMKKISNLKIGREFLVKKNLSINLVKNIKLASLQKNAKAVSAGLQVIDNLTKSDEGIEDLKKIDILKYVSEALDNFENDSNVLKMGAKIYSKICTLEDMKKEIENLKAKQDDSKFLIIN